MNQVVFYPEDIDALTRALQSLHADVALLEIHGAHSTSLGVVVSDLESLRDRMRAVRKETRDQLALHTAYPVAAA